MVRLSVSDLVELPMHDFAVIIGIDLLHCFYACIYYRSRVVRICFTNEKDLVWEGFNSSNPNPLILNLMDNKIMSKGLLCHLVSDNN